MSTKDIIVRKATLKDAPSIKALFVEAINERNAFPFIRMTEYTSEKYKNLRKYLVGKGNHRFFVAIDSKNKVMGTCGYSFQTGGRMRHKVDFGWSVHPDHHGKGIATKLVTYALKDAKARGFKRAEAEACIVNTASWRLATTLGFQIEGIKRKDFLADNGKYLDTYLLGKLL